MNIRNVDSVLRTVDIQKESLDFGDNYILGNLTGFKTLIGKISALLLFKSPRELLLGSSIYTTTSDSITVTESEYSEIYMIHGNIVNGISAILDVFKDLLPPEDAHSVTIKIPEPADFNEAVEFQSDFLMAISQNVMNPKIGGKVVLTAWEPGGFWLTLNLGSSVAVELLGGMASAATAGLKKHREGSVFEEMVKGLDVKKEAIQEILRGLQIYVNMLLDIESKKLHAKHFGETSNPEQEARLLHGIKLFLGLINKGAELKPAVTASDSVKSAFPDFGKVALIGSETEEVEESETSPEPESNTEPAPAPVTAEAPPEAEQLQAA